MIRPLDSSSNSASTFSGDFLGVNNVTPKKKYRKKPDPRAPKVTEPCTECGKRFWSWKALYGHMRCHPDRQWRGINPPSSFNKHKKQPPPPSLPAAFIGGSCYSKMTEEDHEVALCLLMLSNSNNNNNSADKDNIFLNYYHYYDSPSVTISHDDDTAVITHGTTMLESTSDAVTVKDGYDIEIAGNSESTAANSNCQFECSSCKKVFGSHQALGGHRASHKNVKGCFAITSRGDGGEEEESFPSGSVDGNCGGENSNTYNNNNCKLLLGFSGQSFHHHQCNICFRVFSSGQALGGHKRCHSEKLDEPLSPSTGGGLNLSIANDDEGNLGIDLNLPPTPTERDSWALDLRLGL